MTDGVEPIGPDEYRGRLRHLQELMQESGIDAIYLNASSNLRYFTEDWNLYNRDLRPVFDRWN